MIESQDFISGIQSWNSLQALLKCVGREITPCFTASILLGYVGFFASLAGSFSLLLDDDMEAWKVALYESALLPLLYLFFLSASLSVCKRGVAKWKVSSSSFLCEPAACQKWSWHWSPVFGAIHFWQCCWLHHPWGTLSQSVFLRNMHFLTAIVSGVTGILVRRYFWSWTYRSWDGVVSLSWLNCSPILSGVVLTQLSSCADNQL